MAMMRHETCRVMRDGHCYAENVGIELWLEHHYDPRYSEVDENTPWLGKIFDPPNAKKAKVGATYELHFSDGTAAQGKLLKIAVYIPGADVHYMPDDAQQKWAWIFLGLESL